ncbi:Hypothetical predicted protein [Octopus vulgaris]|uniref:Uncharacterized protein n=1 Tax=Octopus vulgaris TaxID=6645 RepID=A0AA36BKN7_OCTVU|nr:Hypothetical predicted protein [Octopus vulgaris]
MHAYYYSILNPETSTTQKETYSIWRCKNLHSRLYIDCNKIRAVRRDILKNKRLTDSEIDKIVRSVKSQLSIPHTHSYPQAKISENSNQQIGYTEPYERRPSVDVKNTINDRVSIELLDGILEQYLVQLHQPFHERAPLPKIINTNKNRKVIEEVDEALGKVIRQLLENSRENALEVIDQLKYSAAYFATQKRVLKLEIDKKSAMYTNSLHGWKEHTGK